jgi:hypothetical protein
MSYFPDEIFSLIFSKLPDNGRDGADMACRRFHAIIEPIRYRSIEIKTSKQLELFVRAITQNPQLCQHVQHAKIMWLPRGPKKHVVPEHWRNGLLVINQYWNEKIAGNTSSTESLHTILCRDWVEYPVVDCEVPTIGKKEETWLSNGIEVILVSILFKALVNLVSLGLLTVEELWRALDYCPGKPLVYGGALTEGVLPKIRKVLRAEGPRCNCPSAQALEAILWLRHPGMESFIYSPSQNNPYPNPPLPLPLIVKLMGTSDVKDFKYGGPMKWQLLQTMLMLPKGLNEIDFVALTPCASFEIFSGKEEGWFHQSLSQSLLHHAHSLRTLSIRFTGWPDFVKEVTGLTFGNTLRELSRLEVLESPINLLLSPDPAKELVLSHILPSSLRSLTIWPQDETARTEKLLWSDAACIGALNIGLQEIISQCPSTQKIFLQCFREKTSFGKLQSLIKDPKVKNLLIS